MYGLQLTFVFTKFSSPRWFGKIETCTLNSRQNKELITYMLYLDGLSFCQLNKMHFKVEIVTRHSRHLIERDILKLLFNWSFPVLV